jgi:hypothetical protein
VSRIDRKDAIGLTWSFLAIAIVPVTVWAMRPRPFVAQSAPQLIEIVRSQTQEEATDTMSARYNGWNTNQNPDVRWQEIEQSLLDSDVEKSEVSGIVTTAKVKLAQSGWPLFAKSGYLDGQKVWLVASSSPYDNGILFCGNTSDAERRQHKIEHFTHNMRIVVINAEAPYQLLSN